MKLPSNFALRAALALAFVPAAAAQVASPATPYVIKTPVAGFKPSSVYLSVTPPSFSFSDMVVGGAPQASGIVVTNIGNQTIPLGVTQQGGDAAFVLSNLCSGSLEPGASCSLGVSFLPVQRGNASATIRVSTGSETQTVQVSGRGLQGVLQAETPSLDLGEIEVGLTTDPRALVITNIGDAPVSGVSFGSLAAPFSMAGSCASVGVGQACSISLAFTPSAPGAASGTLSVNSPVGGFQVGLSGQGLLTQSVVGFVSGSTVSFGEYDIGASAAPVSVQVRNTGNAPLTLTGVSGLPAAVTLSGNTCSNVEPNSSCELSFSLNTAQAVVLNQSVPTLGASTNASVTLTGVVGSTVLVPASATSLAFSSALVSPTPEDRTMTLLNAGTRRASVTGVSGLPASVALHNNGCTDVAPGGTCNLGFRMDRSTPASFTDALVSTQGLNTNATFTMSGQAISDAPTVNYASWDATKLTAGNQLTNNNLSYSFGSQFGVAVSNICRTTGQYYWEVQVTSAQDPAVGVAAKTLVNAARTSVAFGTAGGHVSYVRAGARYLNSNNDAAFGAAYTAGDVIGVALNATSGKVWFSKNGVWQGSGSNPAAGTGALQLTSVGGQYCATFGYAQYFGAGGQSVVGAATANFGQSAFNYTPPAGFNAGLSD